MQQMLTRRGASGHLASQRRAEPDLRRRFWSATVSNRRRPAAVRAEATSLSSVVPLVGRGAPLDFAKASWVADIVTNGMASGAPQQGCAESSLEEATDEEEEDCEWEDLPQGYRCADHVAVHSVPFFGPQGALLEQQRGAVSNYVVPLADLAPAQAPADSERLVVCKMSQFRDPETDELDMFKFAAMANEWTSFADHATQLQDSKYLVQLLGHFKSRTTFTIISEFCNGGDLQSCVDQQQNLLAHAPHHLQPPTLTAGAAGAISSSTVPLPSHLGPPVAPVVAVPSAAPGAPPVQPSAAAAPGPFPRAPRELRVLAGGRMSESQVARVAHHVVKGLATMHKAGLTHGDIKPANVFINVEPRRSSGGRRRVVLKLGDFGTTREKGRQQLHYFVAGFGYSPEYASPEALRHGTGKAGMASDLWSLGVMLVQLLLGHLPDIAVVMARLQSPDSHRERESYLKQHPPALSVLQELADAHVATSPALQQVLVRCLQVLPNARPTDAAELLNFDLFVQRQNLALQQQSMSSVNSMSSMEGVDSVWPPLGPPAPPPQLAAAAV